jgi:methylthioxylose transferase
MFGVTSADGLYMTLGVLAAIALVALPRAVAAIAGGVVLAASSFFAWSLLAVGAWATLLVLLRGGLRRALVLAVACGIALVAFYAGLHAATGFDPIGTLRGTEQVYRTGIARGRPYAFWLLGSPVAFLATLGLPITWYALRALGRWHATAVAIFAVLTVASVLGFTKAETERIWLFFAPFVCLAAATALPGRRLGVVLWLLAAQALACELLFDSVW